MAKRIKIEELTLQNTVNDSYKRKKLREKLHSDLVDKPTILKNRFWRDEPIRNVNSMIYHNIPEELKTTTGIYCIWLVFEDKFIPLYVGEGNIGQRIISHLPGTRHAYNMSTYWATETNHYLDPDEDISMAARAIEGDEGAFYFNVIKEFIHYSYIVETEDEKLTKGNNYKFKEILRDFEAEMIRSLDPLRNKVKPIGRWDRHSMLRGIYDDMTKYVEHNKVFDKILKYKKRFYNKLNQGKDSFKIYEEMTKDLQKRRAA